MRTVTIRDLRSRPREARKILESADEALLTVNGKPVALLLPVNEATVEGARQALHVAWAQQALREIRRAVAAGGLDRMRMTDIDALIARVRRRRHATRGR